MCTQTSTYTCININFTSQMSFPIVFLSMEYLVASSKALWAKPTAPAATCQYKQVNQTFVCIGSLTQLPWNM